MGAHRRHTPEDTRRATADAVTGQILRSGSGSTIALLVPHAQAEDFTDRIRRRLADTGALGETSITGPGRTSRMTTAVEEKGRTFGHIVSFRFLTLGVA